MQCNIDSEEKGSPVKEGRIIFYNVGDENGDAPHDANEEKFFTFKGSSVDCGGVKGEVKGRDGA